MIRRTRRAREIPFNFDSFLDLVANVVGIVVRLILVVWVGARSYDSVRTVALDHKPDAPLASPAEAVEDPLQHELARHRQELAQLQARLLEQMRALEQNLEEGRGVLKQLETLASRRQEAEGERAGLEQAARQQRNKQQGEATLRDLQARKQQLAEELRALEQLPPEKKVLRYRTPVSRPVEAEEFLFECRQGRVTFIDIAALHEEVRRGLNDKMEALRQQWQITDTTAAVGAFRMRYTVERERQFTDALATSTPTADAGFRGGVSEAELEPVLPRRGETASEALTPGSQFRRIADALDSEAAAVTFFVYPDSFDLFRQLREHLYDRNVVVAGRPLTHDRPIAFSRRGSLSRGQ